MLSEAEVFDCLSAKRFERVHFSQNSRNLGDRKCLGKPRKSFVGHPSGCGQCQRRAKDKPPRYFDSGEPRKTGQRESDDQSQNHTGWNTDQKEPEDGRTKLFCWRTIASRHRRRGSGEQISTEYRGWEKGVLLQHNHQHRHYCAGNEENY
jgi:hypothetical protein